MKHAHIAAITLSGLFVAPCALAVASPAPSGQIKIHGEITGTTCRINDGDIDKTLQLPVVGADLFEPLPINSVYKSVSTQATIAITCADYEGEDITLSFNSTNMDENGVIIPSEGKGNGIGFQLAINDIMVDGYKKTYQIKPNNGIYMLPLTAYYYKLQDVKKGTISSVVTYTVTHN
ncbi:fimbrial protein [Edwardsiella tarda]|uniref:fimbrial protein n=1 Tax=Edwardsiella tarda TaxID=636 RepID=UPI00351C48F8